MHVIREALLGIVAGAVGTVALNGVTYGDMIVRGRPASSVPSEVAGQLVEKAGIDLSAENEERGGPTAQNRQSGLGAPGIRCGAWYRRRLRLDPAFLGRRLQAPRRGCSVPRRDGRQ